MGQAMLRGWLAQKTADAFHIVEPHPPKIPDDPRVHFYADASHLPPAPMPHVIILAIKPQMAYDLLPLYQRYQSALFISIMAGQTIAGMKGKLGAKAKIIRAMPNTPAAIGYGITAAVASADVTENDKKTASLILSAIGESLWLDDENQLDAVTALSGSGPAYLFLLIEAMRDAGIAEGLGFEIAQKLALKTMLGSSLLADQASESIEELRQNVTSPNGTTAAALSVLMADDGLKPLIKKAISKAAMRSKELSQ
jgi:pyrroline-5-carboxylate reductase